MERMVLELGELFGKIHLDSNQEFYCCTSNTIAASGATEKHLF